MKFSLNTWWNELWVTRDPEEPIIEFIVDLTSPTPVLVTIYAVVIVGFIVYMRFLDWTMIVKPNRAFERRHKIVEQNGDFSVYDLTDEQLDAYEAEIDF